MAKQRLRLSKGASLSRAKFEEAKHKRDTGGKFADKPGAGNDAPKAAAKPTQADWKATAKTSGIEKTDQIKLQVTSNPKKAGSNSAARFENYKDGITVDGFLKAGGKRSDLAWDNEKGFITIHAPDDYKRLSAGPAPKVPPDVSGINPNASGHLAAIKADADAKAAAALPKPPQPKPGEAKPGEAAKPATPKKPEVAPEPEPKIMPKTGVAYNDDEIVVMPSGKKYTAGEIKEGGKFKDTDIDEAVSTGKWSLANPKQPPKPKEPAKPEKTPEKTPEPPAKPKDTPETVKTFKKGDTLDGDDTSLHGVELKKWEPPKDNKGWQRVEGQDHNLVEPPMNAPGKHGSGVIITEPDGRVWIVKPTNAYGGYQHTFPKGTLDKGEGLSLQANAIKEAYEESGLKVKITGFAGDFKGDTGTSRYYHAQRVGGTPLDHGWESEAVMLVPPKQLDKLLNKQRDKDIMSKHITGNTAEATPKMALPGGTAQAGTLPKQMPNDYRYKAEELVDLPASKVANESDKGLEWEYQKEYLQYGGKNWGPGIKDQADFNKRYKEAPLTYLTDSEYDNLGYTSVNTKKLPTFNDVAPGLKQRKRDPEGIRDRFYNGTTTPPIVMRKGDKLRLMAGQSRIFVGLASGIRVPVKIMDMTYG